MEKQNKIIMKKRKLMKETGTGLGLFKFFSLGL